MIKNNNNIAALKKTIKITDVIDLYTPNLNRRGNVLCCPFCGDTKFKLQIYPETNTFYCHRCRFGADIVDYASRALNKDLKDTMATLQNDFGVTGQICSKIEIEKIEQDEIAKRERERYVMRVNEIICDKLLTLRKEQMRKYNETHIVDELIKNEIRRLEDIYICINGLARNICDESKQQTIKQLQKGIIKI